MTATARPPEIGTDRAGTGGDEPRVSVLTGDRLCARCAFNMNGQTIVRERHYGMLIARCPECGTVAPLQEYPALARAAGRLGFLMGGVYLAGMLAAALLASIVMWHMSSGLAGQLAAPYQAHVTKLWTEFQQEEAKKTPTAAYNYANGQKWWEGLDKNQLFEEAGGWKGGIAWRGFWFAIYMLLAILPFGVLLAIAAPHLRWKGRLVLGALIGGLGAFFWLTEVFAAPAYWYGGWYGWNGWTEVRALRWTLIPVSLAVALGCLTIGFMVGRPLARGLVRLLLPPRLRGPLAFLWFVDGKPYSVR